MYSQGRIILIPFLVMMTLGSIVMTQPADAEVFDEKLDFGYIHVEHPIIQKSENGYLLGFHEGANIRAYRSENLINWRSAGANFTSGNGVSALTMAQKGDLVQFVYDCESWYNKDVCFVRTDGVGRRYEGMIFDGWDYFHEQWSYSYSPQLLVDSDRFVLYTLHSDSWVSHWPNYTWKDGEYIEEWTSYDGATWKGPEIIINLSNDSRGFDVLKAFRYDGTTYLRALLYNHYSHDKYDIRYYKEEATGWVNCTVPTFLEQIVWSPTTQRYYRADDKGILSSPNFENWSRVYDHVFKSPQMVIDANGNPAVLYLDIIDSIHIWRYSNIALEIDTEDDGREYYRDNDHIAVVPVDIDYGIPIREYRWISDKDGVVGNESYLEMSELSPGKHNLHLETVDMMYNHAESNTIQVTIKDARHDYMVMWALIIGVVALLGTFGRDGRRQGLHRT